MKVSAKRGNSNVYNVYYTFGKGEWALAEQNANNYDQEAAC